MSCLEKKKKKKRHRDFPKVPPTIASLIYNSQHIQILFVLKSQYIFVGLIIFYFYKEFDAINLSIIFTTHNGRTIKSMRRASMWMFNQLDITTKSLAYQSFPA